MSDPTLQPVRSPAQLLKGSQIRIRQTHVTCRRYLVLRNDMQHMGLDSMPPRAPRAPTDNPPKKRAPRQLPIDDIPPDDLSAVFGHNLKAARLQRAMTAESLAKAVGMTQQAVSKVESGKSGFTLPTMKKFADFLGLEVGDMLKLPAIEAADADKPAPPSTRKKPSR